MYDGGRLRAPVPSVHTHCGRVWHMPVETLGAWWRGEVVPGLAYVWRLLRQHAAYDEDWGRVRWTDWLPGWCYRDRTMDLLPGVPHTYQVLRHPLDWLEGLHVRVWGLAYTAKALWCLYVLRGGTPGAPPAGRMLGPADEYVLVAITSEPRPNYGAAMDFGGNPQDWDELHVGHGWRRGTWWAEDVQEGNY